MGKPSLEPISASDPSRPVDQGRFVGQVGDPDIHDGKILSFVHNGSTAEVVIRGGSAQRMIAFNFTGVLPVMAVRPFGMLPYAMSEFRADFPLRPFVLSNGEDEDHACLELKAEDFSVTIVQNKAGERERTRLARRPPEP